MLLYSLIIACILLLQSDLTTKVSFWRNDRQRQEKERSPPRQIDDERGGRFGCLISFAFWRLSAQTSRTTLSRASSSGGCHDPTTSGAVSFGRGGKPAQQLRARPRQGVPAQYAHTGRWL